MLQQEFVQYFHHYLDLLQQEIEDYNNDQLLWAIVEGINNSGGNLCTHLIGNLHHFIGQAIGNTGYKRDRPLEFSCIDIPKSTLIQDIQDTKKMIEKILMNIDDLGQLQARPIFEKPATLQSELMRLLTHLSYHIGQINYHRRILQGVQM